ncbi:MAG: Ldh family oxidoreductase [Pseudomonadota bacterium]
MAVLTIEEARALVVRAFAVSDVSPENAAKVADALIAAQVDGQGGHGLSRVASYAAQAASGKVDGHAVPQISRPTPSLLHVDAQYGFAFPALSLLIEELPEIAHKNGIAAGYVYRSHHCGQLGAHVEKLATAGIVALMVANSPPAMAPWGGSTALFGTNPIAFAAPRADGPPLVIDLSLSHVARGKVMAAAKSGEKIPEGWALDADGQPTTNATDALKGTMLPMGDAKGAALALIVEILCATLTGANPSYQATSFFEAEGAPPGVGQTIIAFSPDAAAPGFSARLEGLLQTIMAQDGTRLPGVSRQQKRSAAVAHGIDLPDHLLAEINDIIESSNG